MDHCYWRAWVGGRWRVLSGEPKQIQGGKNAGLWRIEVREVSVPKGGNWRIITKRYLVSEIQAVA